MANREESARLTLSDAATSYLSRQNEIITEEFYKQFVPTEIEDLHKENEFFFKPTLLRNELRTCSLLKVKKFFYNLSPLFLCIQKRFKSPQVACLLEETLTSLKAVLPKDQFKILNTRIKEANKFVDSNEYKEYKKNDKRGLDKIEPLSEEYVFIGDSDDRYWMTPIISKIDFTDPNYVEVAWARYEFKEDLLESIEYSALNGKVILTVSYENYMKQLYVFLHDEEKTYQHIKNCKNEDEFDELKNFFVDIQTQFKSKRIQELIECRLKKCEKEWEKNKKKMKRMAKYKKDPFYELTKEHIDDPTFDSEVLKETRALFEVTNSNVNQ